MAPNQKPETYRFSQGNAKTLEDAFARQRAGNRAFFIGVGGFFTAVVITWSVQAVMTGHGTGFGDGRVLPGGQSLVNGHLDGIGAAQHTTSYPRDAALIALMVAVNVLLVALYYRIASRFGPAATAPEGLMITDDEDNAGGRFKGLHRGTRRVSTVLMIGMILECGVGFPAAVVLYMLGHPIG